MCERGTQTERDYKEKRSGENWTYTYDERNHLIKAEHRLTVGGTVDISATYVYDAFGNRIEKDVTISGTTTVTKFVLDGWDPAKGPAIGNENWDVLADVSSTGSLTSRYLRGDVVDQVFARIDVSGSTLTPYWYLTDNQGSIRAVVDNSGNLQASTSYDAFGNITIDTAPNIRGTYGYVGLAFDPETGLLCARSREENMAIARWQSQDPIGFTAGDPNLYRVVGNEPTDWTDPSGLQGINSVWTEKTPPPAGTPAPGSGQAWTESYLYQYRAPVTDIRTTISMLPTLGGHIPRTRETIVIVDPGYNPPDNPASMTYRDPRDVENLKFMAHFFPIFGSATSFADGDVWGGILGLGLDTVAIGGFLKGAKAAACTGSGIGARSSMMPYEVGTADALRARSVGDLIDIHHVGQAHAFEQLIPGYRRGVGPAIALPEAEHALIPTLSGTVNLTPRQVLARDILNLRNYTNAPNSSLRELIDLNRQLYPGAFKK